MSASEPMTPERWRSLVGEPVEERRRSLFKSRRQAAEGSGVSEIVWRQIESGRRQLAPDVVMPPNPSVQTKAAITRRIGWSTDSIDRLLCGDDPVEVSHAASPDERTNLEAEVAKLRRKYEEALQRIEKLEQR